MLQLRSRYADSVPDQVGRVLRVVRHQRRDGVLVERPHLLGMRRRARGTAAGRCPCRCPRRSARPSGAARPAPARPPGSRGPGRPRRRRTTRHPLCRDAANEQRADEPRSASPRRPRPPGEQRVHPSRPAASVHVLGQGPRMLTRDRRDHMPRPIRRQLGAQSNRAVREISTRDAPPASRTSSASRSSRPRSSSRKDPRRFCSTSSRASSTATSVRHATAATCRNSKASGGQPHPSRAATPLRAARRL